MIEITDLEKALKLNQITKEYTQEELTDWIKLKTDEVTALTGLPVNPVSRKLINPHFNGKIIELQYYYVSCIHSLRIGDACLKPCDYVLDNAAGIIYLNKNYQGLLTVEYIHQINESLESKVDQLILDMIIYTLKTNGNIDGTVTGLRESEQSINYDASNSLGNRIYMRIDELKSNASYSARVKWL